MRPYSQSSRPKPGASPRLLRCRIISGVAKVRAGLRLVRTDPLRDRSEAVAREPSCRVVEAQPVRSAAVAPSRAILAIMITSPAGMIQTARRAGCGVPGMIQRTSRHPNPTDVAATGHPCSRRATAPTGARLLFVMELPVIGGRHAATADEIVRALRKCQVEVARAMARREEVVAGAVLLFHPGRPVLAGAAFDVAEHGPASPREVLAEVEAVITRLGSRLTLIAPTAFDFSPPWIEALSAAGFRPVGQETLILRREASIPAPPATFQAIPARAVASLYRRLVARHEENHGASPEEAVQHAECEIDAFDVDGLDAIALRVAGEVAAAVSVQTVAEFGVLRRVRASNRDGSPEVIDALLWHLLDLCRRCQFRQVIAAVDRGDALSRAAFARLGMERAGMMTHYIRPNGERRP